MDKIKQKIKKIIRFIAIIAIILILVSVILFNIMSNSWFMLILNIIFIAISFFAHSMLKKVSLNVSQDFVDKVFMVGFALFILLQVLFVAVFQMYPGFDFAWAYHMASLSAQGQPLFSEHLVYLFYYPYNYSLVVLFQWIFEIFGTKLEFLFILGGICLSSTVGIIYLTLRRNFSPKVVLISIVLLLLFYPYIAYVVIPYTDTIALPFVALAIFVIFKNKKVQIDLKSIVLFSLIIMVGGIFKILMIIMAIAYFGYVLLKSKWKYCLLALVPFIMYVIGNTSFGYYVNSQHYSYAPYSKSGITPLYFVYIGSNYESKGRYNDEDYSESLQWGIRIEKHEKDDVTDFYIKGISDRLSNLSLTELSELIISKVGATWGNGMYGMNEYIDTLPIKHSAIRDFFISGGGNVILLIITQFIQMFLLVGLYKYVIKKENNLLFNLVFLGFFTYLILFEAGPRYIMMFSPWLFIINANNIERNEL